MPYPEMPKDDNKSEVTNVNAAPEKLDPPKLKVKRLDYYYSSWSKNWKYRVRPSRLLRKLVLMILRSTEHEFLHHGRGAPPCACRWGRRSLEGFCFRVCMFPLRTSGFDSPPLQRHPHCTAHKIAFGCSDLQDRGQKPLPFQGSPRCNQVLAWYLLEYRSFDRRSFTALAKFVVTELVSQLDPEMLLGFVPKLEEHAVALQAQKPIYDEDAYVAQTVNLLLDSLRTDYAETLSAVKHLVSHGEITFDYLYAIFVPQSILITECSVTGEPRAFRLVSHSRAAVGSKIVMQLTVESVDFTDEGVKDGSEVGQVTDTIAIDFFKGIVKITDLDAFPLGFHPQQRHLREKLLDRGHRWLGLVGIHHLQYNSLAVRKNQFSVLKHNVGVPRSLIFLVV